MKKINFQATPWDEAVLNIPTFELNNTNEETLIQASQKPGHYTAKVDPLSNKQLLHQYGFYYCDTLIEPFVTATRFIRHEHADIHIQPADSLKAIQAMCKHHFLHGRFHRDFQLNTELADARYQQWLEQMYEKNQVYIFKQKNQLLGFVAIENNRLQLHAMHPCFQGKGLAKFCWSLTCDLLFQRGHSEITSSVSAANLAVVNLYASLGFRFRKPVDIYHCLVQPSGY